MAKASFYSLAFVGHNYNGQSIFLFVGFVGHNYNGQSIFLFVGSAALRWPEHSARLGHSAVAGYSREVILMRHSLWLNHMASPPWVERKAANKRKQPLGAFTTASDMIGSDDDDFMETMAIKKKSSPMDFNKFAYKK